MASNVIRGIIGKTLKYEDTLPSLPVPRLKQTCAKYLQSVRPCVSDEEFAITKTKVQDFCCGIGPVLQSKLEKRASHSKNWLEKWWEEEAYLKPRYPIAPLINVSGPMMLYEDIWPALKGTQIKRTAITLHFLLNEWKLLYNQEFPIDGKDGTPLSMSQYYNLMSWCRFPQNNVDNYMALLKPAPSPTVRYVTVMTKGRIYKCDVLNSELEPISISEIEAQLRHIVDDASQKPVGPGLGSLTAENRETWTKERQHLVLSNPKHWELLATIQKSLLNVVLEDKSPSVIDELQTALNCGNCKNRWFDKSFQLIIFENGLMGTNLEHLAFDAVILILAVNRALENVKKYWGKQPRSDEIKVSSVCVPKPVELQFDLDDRLHRAIENATVQFEKTSSNIAIRTLIWKQYGKTFIKQHRLHPDTYVQMAIQLADFKLHKRVAPTYETASTRQFYHGRTDTVRSHTTEAQEWCNAMESRQATNKHKIDLLRIACLKHDELMNGATQGLGIDRHLLGLKNTG
ncbi:peroxisomal carnitine O-octanoyltransferase-like [Dendronephthya gigantea]|uniref:peroxisomal carnitine O-octanoyltransferase-like n=1 Tax=Dendronephthya gigantea TaxID=151771 RepID=UPI00106DA518|nr:peroxisomal carnitine O-octanoyltransferase-like [Dendronephthya gigantea]